jgi:SAM-dependent methyltransferase
MYPGSGFSAYGMLSVAAASERDLALSGWIIAPGGERVDALRVFFGALEVQARVAHGLPSPDLGAAMANVPGSQNARFTATVSAEACAVPMRDLLIAVVPVAGGKAGNPIFTLHKPDVSLPAESDLKVTGGSFKAAYEFLGHFVHFCGLRPGDAVLEAGCGVGRMAYPLAYYLQPPGRYEGFDIVAPLIEAANNSLTRVKPHVRFRFVDLWNSLYNPAGKLKSSQFQFPYPDGSFDMVFLTSVFTHMLPPDVRRYLAEIHRVLRPSGRLFVTCFLLTPDAEELIRAGRSSLPLIHERAECKIFNPDVPEEVIGFEPDRFFSWLQAAGFSRQHFAPGFWCGRSRQASYQDIVVAARVGG